MSLLSLISPFLPQSQSHARPRKSQQVPEPSAQPTQTIDADANRRRTERARRKRWQNQCEARLRKKRSLVENSTSTPSKELHASLDLARYLTKDWKTLSKEEENLKNRRPQQRALWSYLLQSCNYD
jgi:hypothetical protein